LATAQLKRVEIKTKPVLGPLGHYVLARKAHEQVVVPELTFECGFSNLQGEFTFD
jgi:hypothetical protein